MTAGASDRTRGKLFKFLQNSISPQQLRSFEWRGTAVACLKHIELHPAQKQFVDFMTSRQAKLQEDTYFRAMRILQENPDLTQRELAEKLGISVGGLNYCLKALMEKGMVKMKNFATSKNKFGYVYVLTPTGIAEKAAITHRFLQRKMDEYEALKAEIETLRSEVDKPDGKGTQKT
jgi:EPS-associated MarR family transcriptional regulator